MRFLLVILVLFVSSPALAQGEAGAKAQKDAFRTTGLPIPRFVSLRSDRVFVRSGPALRYPIKWIFQREALPVEVIQEFDTWRKIRDIDGDEGWIHQSLLSGKRTVIVQSKEQVPLYRGPAGEERIVARLEPKVLAELLRCMTSRCEVSAGGYKGWLERNILWGIYEEEKFD